MPWAIAIILVLPWVLGLATHYTLGGSLHILLLGAIVVMATRVLWVRRSRSAGRNKPVGI